MTLTSSVQNNNDSLVKEFLKGYKRVPTDWMALHFHISKLMPYNRQSYQVKEAFAQLNKIFAPLKAKTMFLRNDDFICILPPVSFIQIERCISQFKRTFISDPVVSDNLKRERFYNQYKLDTNFEDFKSTIFEIENNNTHRSSMTVGHNTTTHEPVIIDGIKLETLNLIRDILQKSDLSNYLRRQPICWYDGKQQPKIMSYQFYFSLTSLLDDLKINESISGNIWLFNQLTFYLDREMLKFGADFFNRKGLPSLHINLNLRTLITNYFHSLMYHYQSGKDITFEIDILDILAHPEAMIYAQTFLKEKNCFICTKLTDISLVEYLNLEKIQADSYKINWSERLLDKQPQIQNLLESVGNEKVILHKCDNKSAIETGLSLGISKFQGKFIDTFLREIRK